MGTNSGVSAEILPLKGEPGNKLPHAIFTSPPCQLRASARGVAGSPELRAAQNLSREVNARADVAELDSAEWKELIRAAANVDGWIYVATYIGGARPFSECEREVRAAIASTKTGSQS